MSGIATEILIIVLLLILNGVFAMSELAIDVMTPRTRLDCLDAEASPETWRAQVAAKPSTRYLVCEGNLDQILGVVFAEDLLAQCVGGKSLGRAVSRVVVRKQHRRDQAAPDERGSTSVPR